MKQLAEISTEDQQYINDLNLAWLESKWAKYSGSNMISLVTGVDDPELLGKTMLSKVHETLPKLKAEDIGKTGKPLIGSVRDLLGWSKPITTDQLNYALKMLNPHPEGLKTYAEKVAVQAMTHFSPDPELTKPWIIRGKEYEAIAIQQLSNILNMDFQDTGHDQKFIIHPDHPDYGSTPDGRYLEGGKAKLTLEGKAPNTETHLKYTHIKDSKSLKLIEPRYFWQTQSQMDSDEVEKGLFYSFDDRFKDEYSHLNIHYCYLERDDQAIKQIHQRLDMARQWQERFMNEYVR